MNNLFLHKKTWQFIWLLPLHRIKASLRQRRFGISDKQRLPILNRPARTLPHLLVPHQRRWRWLPDNKCHRPGNHGDLQHLARRRKGPRQTVELRLSRFLQWQPLRDSDSRPQWRTPWQRGTRRHHFPRLPLLPSFPIRRHRRTRPPKAHTHHHAKSKRQLHVRLRLQLWGRCGFVICILVIKTRIEISVIIY